MILVKVLGYRTTLTYCSVVRGRHSVVRSKLVDLDLAKLSDIADLLALQGAEIGGDAAVLEVNDTSERLVEQRTNRQDREVTSFGLPLVRFTHRRGQTRRFLQQACESWLCSQDPPSVFR
jgi:hypothetical protein